MKTYSQKKKESVAKLDKQIWAACGIEKAVKKFGFEAVKHSLNKWTTYQRENAKLLREKRALLEKLSELEGKL